MEMGSYHYRRQPRQHRFKQLGWLLLLTTMAGVWVVWHMPRVHMLSVQSGSMLPVINKGDAVIVEPVAADHIYAGDIVSYHSSHDARLVITHRVQSVDIKTGRIVTKGDNNTSADPPFAVSQVIGRVQSRLIKIGMLIDILHSRIGIIAIVYVPALLVMTMELRRLTRHFRPTYCAMAYRT